MAVSFRILSDRECGPVRCAQDVTRINRRVNDPNDDAKLIEPEATGRWRRRVQSVIATPP